MAENPRPVRPAGGRTPHGWRRFGARIRTLRSRVDEAVALAACRGYDSPVPEPDQTARWPPGSDMKRHPAGPLTCHGSKGRIGRANQTVARAETRRKVPDSNAPVLVFDGTLFSAHYRTLTDSAVESHGSLPPWWIIMLDHEQDVGGDLLADSLTDLMSNGRGEGRRGPTPRRRLLHGQRPPGAGERVEDVVAFRLPRTGPLAVEKTSLPT